ncbi:Uma2 family endonuclease [Salisaeta longa]|uniref:Uma2 family endonuclease n=1 Tax=Salisaeta longa TaxID=503170 RepID=UPI0003B77231|nr:Uma2 family endonuclease [Salisaeta longa]
MNSRRQEAPPRPRRFTVAEYHAMARAGLFGEDDPIELLNGQIYVMSPIGSQHAACVDRLTRLLLDAVGDRAIVRVRSPIQLDETSEPEPDLALLRPRADGYATQHPQPGDVPLVVEVADTTLAFDRDVKGSLYAAAGLPTYWLVDLTASVVHVYQQPADDGTYRVHTTHDDQAVLSCRPWVEALPTADILGAATSR